MCEPMKIKVGEVGWPGFLQRGEEEYTLVPASRSFRERLKDKGWIFSLLFPWTVMRTSLDVLEGVHWTL